jgi:hypothetical protein
MGQYGNQPDFGTKADGSVRTIGDGYTGEGGDPFKPAAIYIGTGGTLVCTIVGGDNNGSNTTIFRNIPDGTFFPVIITNVWAEDSNEGVSTTCADIVALY